jgi:hypothetical protein
VTNSVHAYRRFATNAMHTMPMTSCHQRFAQTALAVFRRVMLSMCLVSAIYLVQPASVPCRAPPYRYDPKACFREYVLCLLSTFHKTSALNRRVLQGYLFRSINVRAATKTFAASCA